MKKVLALLLAVLMLASIGCAWAEETAEEPVEEPVGITFQDIPWGSSYEDVILTLVTKGILKEDASVELRGDGDVGLTYPDEKGNQQIYIPPFYDYGFEIHPQALKLCGIYQSYMMDDFQIAGYTVESLNLLFAFDGTSTQLIAINISLKPIADNIDNLLIDMTQKLASVYGESGIISDEEYYQISNDDSFIFLSRFMGSSATFMYGVTDAFNILEECSKPLFADTPTVDSSDTSGL